MNTNRVNEMVASMKSFSKEKYQKSELLKEMLALQEEIVTLTFNEEHASLAELKIWDVERHLEQLNQYCGNVADDELSRFKSESKDLCNLIKAEISGNRGEAKAFRALQDIKTKNVVLRNVELSDGNYRTELDAVVVTSSAVTIVEVKNTSRNIFIDDNGDYYRTGEYLKWDSNIAAKMERKEWLLRKVLASSGVDNIYIQKIVVFTDNRVEVQNKYPSLKTCFLSQLAYMIDNSNGAAITEKEIDKIVESIETAECKEEYPFKFDVAQYKNDFATLMVMLEEAATKIEELSEEQDGFRSKRSVWNALKETVASWYEGYGGQAVTTAAITCISTVAINVLLKKPYIR